MKEVFIFLHSEWSLFVHMIMSNFNKLYPHLQHVSNCDKHIHWKMSFMQITIYRLNAIIWYASLSHWSHIPITGKTDYLSYLKLHFACLPTIRNHMHCDIMRIKTSLWRFLSTKHNISNKKWDTLSWKLLRLIMRSYFAINLIFKTTHKIEA